MWLTDLADVLRAADLDVVEVDAWRTRGHGPMTSVDGIIAHHTAGPATGDYPSLRTVRDGRKGLPGPLAQLGIGRSGRVWVIAAGLAYHAGAVTQATYTNGRRIGIEAEATGRDVVDRDNQSLDWPAVQMNAYVRACAALAVRYSFTAADVLGHKEVCSPPGRKIDPHPVDMAAFRRLVDRQISDLQSTSRDVPRMPAPVTPRPVLTDGTRGSVVRALQTRLEQLGWEVGPVDGVFGPATERAVIGVQVAGGVVADGVVGPRTWRVIDGGQRPQFTAGGVLARGARGPVVRAVQRSLTRVGVATDDDGVFGPATESSVERRQRVRGLLASGRVDAATAASLGGRV